MIIRPINWWSITSMDTARMFGLAQMLAIRHVRFIAPRAGSSINNYILAPVWQTIVYKARLRRVRAWSPTGLENPCPRVE
jgi:hypothetical protein